MQRAAGRAIPGHGRGGRCGHSHHIDTGAGRHGRWASRRHDTDSGGRCGGRERGRRLPLGAAAEPDGYRNGGVMDIEQVGDQVVYYGNSHRKGHQRAPSCGPVWAGIRSRVGPLGLRAGHCAGAHPHRPGQRRLRERRRHGRRLGAGPDLRSDHLLRHRLRSARHRSRLLLDPSDQRLRCCGRRGGPQRLRGRRARNRGRRLRVTGGGDDGAGRLDRGGRPPAPSASTTPATGWATWAPSSCPRTPTG